MIRAALVCAAVLTAFPSAAFAREASDAPARGAAAADGQQAHGEEPGGTDQHASVGDPDRTTEDNAMPGQAPDGGEATTVPAPTPPDDHAADAYFDPVEMARAREALRRENGAFSGSMVLFDLAEVQVRDGREGYRWEGEAWLGGDTNRLLIKTKGEGDFGERIGDVELQALWSRAVTPFFNAQLGVRYDVVPNPSRTYIVAGIEGIAPYWLHVSGQLFLSNAGDLHARVEASYDERVTQRLIFQPRAEFNFSAQDVPAIGIGSGLSEFELGARLRYEIRKEFAPYVGVEWMEKTGKTADFIRAAGDAPSSINLVFGVRTWF